MLGHQNDESQELRWAKEANIPIQPVIRASDKQCIGEFLAAAPPDLQDLGNIDWIALDRTDIDYWKVCVCVCVCEGETNPRSCAGRRRLISRYSR